MDIMKDFSYLLIGLLAVVALTILAFPLSYLYQFLKRKIHGAEPTDQPVSSGEDRVGRKRAA